MKIVKSIFIVLIIALGISFAVLNAKSVPLNYYFDAKEISLALLLALTLAIGALLGMLLSIPSVFRLKRSNRQMKSRLKSIEKDIDHLRLSPLRDNQEINL